MRLRQNSDLLQALERFLLAHAYVKIYDMALDLTTKGVIRAYSNGLRHVVFLTFGDEDGGELEVLTPGLGPPATDMVTLSYLLYRYVVEP